MRNPVDHLMERWARDMARRVSRRRFLGGLGALLFGAATVPLLPVARGETPRPAAGGAADPGDPQTCEYWRHCAIDGFLCSCCGGSVQSCPPGTEASAVTWVGTCHNPGDGHDYIVSYNDCCGKTSCGKCFCNRNEREKPLYKLSLNNDINWCMANGNSNFHCSVSVLLGAAKQ